MNVGVSIGAGAFLPLSGFCKECEIGRLGGRTRKAHVRIMTSRLRNFLKLASSFCAKPGASHIAQFRSRDYPAARLIAVGRLRAGPKAQAQAPVGIQQRTVRHFHHAVQVGFAYVEQRPIQGVAQAARGAAGPV